MGSGKSPNLLLEGDCLSLLRGFTDSHFSSIVTDPPYEISMMSKGWDSSGIAFNVELWQQCLRVLKPGGHLLAFGAPRTWHRLTVAIEDAGFEIRDSIAWLQAQGMPHGLDVGKAVDKKLGGVSKVIGVAADFSSDGARRKTDGSHTLPKNGVGDHGYKDRWSAPVAVPETVDAQRFEGWNTALKPGFEPIVVARKPLVGTVAENALQHGTGAYNINACRVGDDEVQINHLQSWSGFGQEKRPDYTPRKSKGRWPANVALTHDVECGDAACAPGCPVAVLDEQAGIRRSGANPTRRRASKFQGTYGKFLGDSAPFPVRGAEAGVASRFYPVFRFESKAPKSERPVVDGRSFPTVKPLALMSYLVRLVTPPGGLVLDIFAGSGTTLQAASDEGFAWVGIEKESAHIEFIEARLNDAGIHFEFKEERDLAA